MKDIRLSDWLPHSPQLQVIWILRFVIFLEGTSAYQRLKPRHVKKLYCTVTAKQQKDECAVVLCVNLFKLNLFR